MTDVRARVIWESPAGYVDYSIKILDALRLAEPLLNRRLHQTMNRKDCQVACSIDEGCSEEVLRRITDTEKITSAQSFQNLVEIAG